jgi:hypothetical protein
MKKKLKEALKEILKTTILIEKYIYGNIEILINELSLQTKYRSPIEQIERKIKILKEHSVILKQLRANLIFALKKDWIENLDANMKNQDKLPRVPFYRTVYSLYQQLNKGYILTKLKDLSSRTELLEQ